MTNQTYDPWDAASDPQPQTFENKGFWGEIFVDAAAVALVKGVGKVPYDAQQHGDKRPLTMVKLEIATLQEQNVMNPIAAQRTYIAEFDDWISITWPSLKALGIKALPEIKNKFCHVDTVENGKTYEKTKDDGTTVTRPETVFKFTKLFASQAECRADYLANGGGNNGNTPPWETPQQAQAPASNGKDAALQFLRVIVTNAARGQSDLNTVRKTVEANLAGFPVVNQYFTIDSPETQQMILEAMAHG